MRGLTMIGPWAGWLPALRPEHTREICAGVEPIADEIGPEQSTSAPEWHTTMLRSAILHRRRLAGPLAFALIAVALLLFGDGVWLYAKARLAQVLLHNAWQRTLAGEERARPWPWADTAPVARLTIPSQDADFIVLSGVSGRTMAFGPGHLDGSAMPGQDGNCVISGHRDTQFTVLRRVDRGDTIFVETADGLVYHYTVRQIRVVDRGDLSVIRSGGRSILTLITCYPFDAIVPGGRLRYVVVADLR